MFSGVNELKKIFKRDIFYIYGLLLFAIVLRYFAPTIIGDVFFIVLLVLFFISKKNYFYLAFLFILIDPPGYLFYKFGIFHLPEINISFMGRSIFYDEIFVFVVIIKSLFIKSRVKLFYKKELMWIFIYILFLFFITYVYGTNIYKLLRAFRFVLPFALFILIPRLLHTRQELLRFGNLMFSFVIIIFLSQLVDIIFGNPVASYLGEYHFFFAGHEYYDVDQKIFDIEEGPIRSIYSVSIILFTYILGLFYLSEKESIFNQKYILVLVVLLFLSVLLSATRGWIIGFTVIFIFYLLQSGKNIRGVIISSVIAGLLIASVPIINKQFSASFSRLKTVTAIIEGDYTAEGTTSRLTVQGPKVMKKFFEKPFFGFGFSEEYFEYMDGHVGNQTLLLNGGIIGFILYLIFLGKFILTMLANNVSKKHKQLKIFGVGLLGIIIIHSTSAMIFSFITGPAIALSLTLIFNFANHYFQYYKMENLMNLPHSNRTSTLTKKLYF